MNYMKEVAKGHHITALLGYTLQTSRSEGLSLYGKNFTNDLLTWNNLADSETSTRLVGSSASGGRLYLIWVESIIRRLIVICLPLQAGTMAHLGWAGTTVSLFSRLWPWHGGCQRNRL